MSDIDAKLKKLEEQMKSEKKSASSNASYGKTDDVSPKEKHPLAEFLIGLVLLGVGIYWILNSFVVSFSWGSFWSGIGIGTPLATGLMLVPLLIGIGLAFFMKHKWVAGVVIAIGLLIILVTLLTSVRFRPISASLWQYILMFGMVAAGLGLTAKGLLRK